MAGRFNRAPARRWTPAELDTTLAALSRLYGSTGATTASPPVPRTPSRPALVAAPTYPLVGLCRAAGICEPVPEYEFHPHRKWRFDYAWPLQRIALEVDGGIWSQGRHVRGAGRKADMEKFTQAARFGWRVVYFEPDELVLAVPLLAEMLA